MSTANKLPFLISRLVTALGRRCVLSAGLLLAVSMGGFFGCDRPGPATTSIANAPTKSLLDVVREHGTLKCGYFVQPQPPV